MIPVWCASIMIGRRESIISIRLPACANRLMSLRDDILQVLQDM